jgi:hypothetical protein
MAKRNSSKTSSRSRKNGKTQTSSASTVDSVEERVVVIAEQVGRIVGTVQAKAEGWFDRKALSDQFASVRDKAAEMVEHLTGAAERVLSKATRTQAAAAGTRSSRGRSGDMVDAPGKKHRKPMPSTHGTKHSDTRIAKMKVSNEARRPGGR